MQIVTDTGTDLSAEQLADLSIHFIPHTITLDGKVYRVGIDITPDEFYPLLASAKSFPITSLPSPSEFAGVYRELAKDDPDILAIHMSSGLSETYNAACAGAEMVPEANITVVDTKTMSCALGWQVEAAARAAMAGWPVDEILPLLDRINAATYEHYTLSDLKYLIHGGRISHMKGLIASVLNIKPIIGVGHADGRYIERSRVRSFKRAVKMMVDLIEQHHGIDTPMRLQVMHSYNFKAADALVAQLKERFDYTFLPGGLMSLVSGAHTGPSMVGVVYAPQALWDEMPWEAELPYLERH